MAESLSNRAKIYADFGIYDEAAILFQKSLEIYEKALGPDDPLLAEVLEGYAQVLNETGRLEEGSEMMSRAAKAQTAAPSTGE